MSHVTGASPCRGMGKFLIPDWLVTENKTAAVMSFFLKNWFSANEIKNLGDFYFWSREQPLPSESS